MIFLRSEIANPVAAMQIQPILSKPKLWTQIARELQAEQRSARAYMERFVKFHKRTPFFSTGDSLSQRLAGRPVLQEGRDEDM